MLRYTNIIILLLFFCILNFIECDNLNIFRIQKSFKVVKLNGYTRSRRVMDLISKEQGYCHKVLADIGQTLRKNGIFARLETTFIDISIKQNIIIENQLRVKIKYYEKEVNRYRQLIFQNNSDQATLDKLEYQLKNAAYELDLNKAKKEELLERKKRYTIYAKPYWKVIERFIEPGEWVKSGELLGKAGDFTTLLVPFALSYEEYKSLKNQEKIYLDISNGKQKNCKIEAKLERIFPQFDPETRKINIELSINGRACQFRGGVLTHLHLKVPDPGTTFLIPKTALIQSYEEYFLQKPSTQKKVKVILLGDKENEYKISSSKIKIGEQFLLNPKKQK